MSGSLESVKAEDAAVSGQTSAVRSQAGRAATARLPVTLESVTEFSRSLRDNGIPAWQRLQAVRAVEAYRDLVLHTGEIMAPPSRARRGPMAM